MTRSEAAKICQSIKFMLDREDYSEEVEEALNMAIAALDQEPTAEYSSDVISRQAAIDATKKHYRAHDNDLLELIAFDIEQLPSVQPKKEIAKRVLWTGWKGYRNTRYKCPNCKKPVKNDDIHCHRCGQKLMFPHISFTDYVPGEKQETIVRWDDE